MFIQCRSPYWISRNLIWFLFLFATKLALFNKKTMWIQCGSQHWISLNIIWLSLRFLTILLIFNEDSMWIQYGSQHWFSQNLIWLSVWFRTKFIIFSEKIQCGCNLSISSIANRCTNSNFNVLLALVRALHLPMTLSMSVTALPCTFLCF